MARDVRYNDTSTVRVIRPLPDGRYLMVTDCQLILLTPAGKEFTPTVRTLTNSLSVNSEFHRKLFCCMVLCMRTVLGMRIKHFRIVACMMFLLLTLIVIPSCNATGFHTSCEERPNTAENQGDRSPETESSDNEDIYFPEGFLCLFHGSSQWGEKGYENLKVLSEAENPNPCMRLLMMRVAKDQEHYRTYQKTLISVYPSADISGFPEIAEEWFRDNNLLTLFVVEDIVCDSIRITSRIDTGSGYYLFCETDKEHSLAGGTPECNCGTLLVPVKKEQADRWKDIGLFLYSKYEKLHEPIEEKVAALKTKYSYSVEMTYKEAIYMQGEDEKAEFAFLGIDENDVLISDGFHDNIKFPVQIRLKNEALLFPEEADRLATYEDLMNYRNAVYEEFASKYQLTWIEGDPPSDYYKVEDLSRQIPEWQLFLLVTVPELNEILNDDLVALVYSPRSCDSGIQ